MLIKKRKLSKTKLQKKVIPIEITEAAKIAQAEIQKAKEEAKHLKSDAENVLIEAHKRLAEAEKKAQSIIYGANKEAEDIKKTTYKETLELANKEADEIKARSKKLLADLFIVKGEALHQAHGQIINIALDLAEKIIKYKASVDPNILKTQVTEAIKKATSDADRVQVYVNPQDEKVLEESKGNIEKLFPTGTEIIVLTDEIVDQGSCIIESKSGQLDARFSTQLKALVELVTHLELPQPTINISEDVEIEVLEEEPPIQEIEEKVKKENPQKPEEMTAAKMFTNMTKVTKVEPIEYVTTEKSIDEIKSPLLSYLEESNSLEHFIDEQGNIQPEEPSQHKVESNIDVSNLDLTENQEDEMKELLSDKPLIEEYNEAIKEDISEFIVEEVVEEDDKSNESFQNKIEEIHIEEFQEEQNKEKVDKQDLKQQEAIQLEEELNEEENNEGFQLEYEEFDEEENDKSSFQLEYEELDEEEINEEEKFDTGSILKPKKKNENGISKLAKEVEDNPEWKDLLEE